MGNTLCLRFRFFTVLIIAFLFLFPSLIFETSFELVGSSSASSPPTIVNVTVSSRTTCYNSKVYVNVNATDNESLEQDLRIIEIEWRRNSGGSWSGSDGSFNTNLTEGYHSGHGGWIIGSMKPTDSTPRVAFDIRVKVEDEDNNSSNWVALINAFTNVPPPPPLIDVTLSASEVYRGDTAYIFLNASGCNQQESELTVEYRYKLTNETTWTVVVAPASEYNAIEELWAMSFFPDTTWDDDSLGDYQFEVRVKNNVSNSDWEPLTGSTTVLNNKPEAIDLSVADDEDTVERGSTIILLANAYDRESDEDELTATFEVSPDGSTWTNLTGEDYSRGRQRWEVDFTPNADFVPGQYHFQVIFSDGVDNSGYLDEKDLVTITNAVPVVTSLLISTFSAYRMDTVTLTAMVADADQDTNTLIPNFQFKGPNDSTWVIQSNVTYFKNPFEGNPGYWQITFKAPSGADIGNYSFRVEFTDETDNVSKPYDIINALTIENIAPEVNIETPIPGSNNSPIITFKARAYDEDGWELTWEWDFGDGETSNEESPVHFYRHNGDYEITVTVTDRDGGKDIDTVRISLWDIENWDSDNDGLTDIEEIEIGTDRENPDSDSDGVSDGQDFYPLDPSQWLSPVQIFLQGVLVIALFLTLILSYILYSKLKNKKEE